MKREASLLCIAAVGALVAWTLFAGKDASWDVYNHHLYVPFSYLSGRYELDLFGAGPQSYQSPIGYIPGYLLAISGVPAWSVGTLLAALQGALIAWALHRLTTAVWGTSPEQRPYRGLAMAGGLTAPVLLLVIGTTSNDPLVAGLSLLALAAVVDPNATTRSLAVGGAALGLALAIKLTAMAFVIAIAILLLLRFALRQLDVCGLLAFAVAAVAGLALSGGEWMAWLWSTFDNPVFPLFNQYFNSPYAPSGPTVAHRFLPTAPLDWVARLWEMTEFRSFTITEAFAPDARMLLAATAGLVVLLAMSVRRPSAWTSATLWRRADLQLGVTLVVVYLLWLGGSGNGRYALGLFILGGLLSVRAMQLLLPERWATLVIALMVGVQTLAYTGPGDRRYNGVPWDDRPYLDAEVAPRLASEPFLHLSLGVQSYAAAALVLNPDGALANVSGQLALPMTGPLGEQLQQRLHQWQGRTRFLLVEPPAFALEGSTAPVLKKIRYLTYRLGLEPDWDDCERVVLNPAAPQQMHMLPKTGENDRGIRLLSCRAMPVTDRDLDIETRVAEAEHVFALVEDSCPSIFGPRPFESEVGPTVVQRLYGNSDTRLNVSPTEGVTLTHFRSLSVVSLGDIEHVLSNGGRDACQAWEKLWNR